MRRHDGEFRWHLSRAMPFRDADGRHGLVFGVTPAKALSFGKGEHFSQTRYRFTT